MGFCVVTHDQVKPSHWGQVSGQKKSIKKGNKNCWHCRETKHDKINFEKDNGFVIFLKDYAVFFLVNYLFVIQVRIITYTILHQITLK